MKAWQIQNGRSYALLKLSCHWSFCYLIPNLVKFNITYTSEMDREVVCTSFLCGWKYPISSIINWYFRFRSICFHKHLQTLDILLHMQICEDVPQILDADVPGLAERPINIFLPRLFRVISIFYFHFSYFCLCDYIFQLFFSFYFFCFSFSNHLMLH